MVGDGQRAVEQQEVTRWCSAARQNVEHRPRVAQQVEVRRRAAAPDFAKLEQAQMDGEQLSDERVSGPGDDKAAGVSNLWGRVPRSSVVKLSPLDSCDPEFDPRENEPFFRGLSFVSLSALPGLSFPCRFLPPLPSLPFPCLIAL
jgi:hypothetical protein